MAGESLIDFGNLANLALQQRQLDIYDQNSRVKQERADLEERQIQQSDEHARLTALIKLGDDDRVRSNPEVADKIMKAAFSLAAPGVEIPETSFREGREAKRKALLGMQSGDQATTMQGLLELQTMMSPEDVEKYQKSIEGTAKMADVAANLEAVKELRTVQTEKLRSGMAKVNVGLAPVSQGVRDFTAALQGIDSPEFVKLHKSYQALSPKQREQFAKPPGVQQTAQASSQLAVKYKDAVDRAKQQLELANAGEALPPGVTVRALTESIEVGQTMMDAYTTLGTFANDPYNPASQKSVKAVQSMLVTKKKELDALSVSNRSMSESMAREALTFRQTEAGIKHFSEQAVREASAESLKRFGYTPTAEQLSEVASKFNVAPKDIVVGDPAKRGKLSLDINDPTTATRTHMQTQLTGVQSTLNIIGNLKDTVSQNNIGLAAALKSTAYGFGAQIKGLAETVSTEAVQANHKNFTPSKWFDPKLTTVDLLANTLAYRLINQEQGGRVSDKDFMEMKKRLNITSWMAGKEDVVQRLTVLEQQLKFEEGVYRKIMPTFAKPGGSNRTIATAEDYLHSIGLGTESP